MQYTAASVSVRCLIARWFQQLAMLCSATEIVSPKSMPIPHQQDLNGEAEETQKADSVAINVHISHEAI